MLDMQVLFTFLLGLADARVVARNADTLVRVSTLNAYTGTIDSLTTIKSDTNLWVSGPGTHNIYGNLDNSGAFTISQTDNTNAGHLGQNILWQGVNGADGNLNNRAGASILLNDINAASGTIYDWYLNSMTNNGIIQWCGRGDTGGSTYQLWSLSNSVNNGLIVFEQVAGNKGLAATWRNNFLDGTMAALVNNGGFLMRSIRVDFVHNLKGTGCLMIGNSAIMYMQDGTGLYQNPTGAPTFAGQSISFLDTTGVLHMDWQVYYRNANFGAPIYDFGAGNAIEFEEYIGSFSYYDGVLSVTMTSGNKVRLNVGTGYQAEGFYTAASTTFYGKYNAIFYANAAPVSNPPATCLLSTDRCAVIPNSGKPLLLTTASPAPAVTSLSLQSASATAIVTAPTTKISVTSAGPTTIVPGGVSAVTGTSATLTNSVSVPTTIPTVSLTAIPTATTATTFTVTSAPPVCSCANA